MAKAAKKKQPPKQDKPLKVNMTFEELLRAAATTPKNKGKKK